MGDLLGLAERFVRLNAEIEETRSAMLAALMNGAGDKPQTPFIRPARPSSGISSEAAKAAEAQILELLKTKPMKAAEIAAATAAKLVTTHDRLRRLRQRGLAAPVDGAWAATA
jgi:hypothetical protein